MQTNTELEIFARGYYAATPANELPSLDDWVIFDHYDINMTGADYAQGIEPDALRVTIYPAGWIGTLPAPLHTFTINP